MADNGYAKFSGLGGGGGGGGGVTSLNTLTGALTLAAGTGISITPSGSTLTIANIGAGAGTVSSVGLTAPSFLSVAGSPVTSTGTIALTLATQTANTVFAGPSTGAAAAPTFRSIVVADIPTLNQNTTGTASNITGNLAVGQIAPSVTNGQVITTVGGVSAWAAASGGAITTVPGSITQNNVTTWGAANSALQDSGMQLTTTLMNNPVSFASASAPAAFVIKGRTNTGGPGGDTVIQEGAGTVATGNDGHILLRDHNGNDNIKFDVGNGAIYMVSQASATNPLLYFPSVNGGFGCNGANNLFLGSNNTIRFNAGSSLNCLVHISDNNGNSASIGVQGVLAATTISPFKAGYFGTTGVFSGQASGTVGTTYPASASMGVVSTTQAFLLPAMTTTQKNAIASPVAALQVYDTTLGAVSFYNGTAWITSTPNTRTAVSANYTALATDKLVAVTATATAITITLPAVTLGSATSVFNLEIKDESGGAATHNITATPVSGTIDGAATLAITTNYGSLRLYAQGTNWFTR